MMNDQTDFEIHYQFRGEPRHFNHQTQHLCESDAWHFAKLHAGVWEMDDGIAFGPVKLAILLAEERGVTQVHWKKSLLESKA